MGQGGAERLSERLSEPWAKGSQAASLRGRIAGKRRLGDCLVFADLVPLDSPTYAPVNYLECHDGCRRLSYFDPLGHCY